MMGRRVAVVAVSVAMVFVAACARAISSIDLRATDVVVELDMFSGRENPRWQLDEEGLAQVDRRLKDLPTSSEMPQPPGLGYRGFRVRSAEQGLDVLVFNGAVVVSPDTPRAVAYEDKAGLEAWLVADAKRRGHDVPGK